MGMAASQARLLNLQARQSNLEYQGQQINQERSILSQQCTAMYNSLLAMKVPTPPSTSDYTTIQYIGVDGATNFTIGAVKPSGEYYSVEIKTTATGKSISKDYGSAICSRAGETIKCNNVNIETLDTVENLTPVQYYISASDIDNYYVDDKNGNGEANGNPKLLKETNYVTYNPENNCYILNNTSSIILYQASADGVETIVNKNAGQQMIAGHLAYTFNEAENTAQEDTTSEFAKYDWGGYRTAINNTFNGEYKPENFMIYFETSNTGVTSVKFALTTDVENADNFTETYSFEPNGTFTKSEEKDDCTLEFDSQGMITKIGIPKYSSTGALERHNYVDLQAEKVTDNAAYKDAYSQYEYEQYEYDRKQQEINAKTEVLQQQDRNLELKLQRLDNERTQITTEIEAVEKVINENIEKSYKTFSG